MEIVRFKKLQVAREQAGLTENQVAFKAKVSAKKIHEYENGIRDTEAYLDELCKLARFFRLKLVQVI